MPYRFMHDGSGEVRAQIRGWYFTLIACHESQRKTIALGRLVFGTLSRGSVFAHPHPNLFFVGGLLLALLLSSPLASADAVADWNTIALTAVTASGHYRGLEASRVMAMVNTAMSEAINFNEAKGPSRLVVTPSRALGSSSEATAAAAAHYVLAQLYPEQKASLDAALQRSLALVPDHGKRESGRIMGRALGMNLYAILSSEAKSALTAGFGLAATVGVIHAQAKPPVFVITETDITNMDRYIKEYAPKVQALIKRHGGRFLAASTHVTAIDGRPPVRIAVQEWQSMEKVKGNYGSAEYKDLRKIGDKYAKFRIYAVEGR